MGNDLYLGKPRFGNLKMLVVSHITEAHGPVQALRDYLHRNVNEFDLITHPMYNYAGFSSHQIIVKDQKSYTQHVQIPNVPEFLHYIWSFILTLFFVIRSRRRYDLYIGIDNLNALVGILFKRIGIVNKVVFYVADYSENRFRVATINLMYKYITRLCARHVDVIWSITQRAAHRLEKKGAKKDKLLIVPNGVNANKIPKRYPKKSGVCKRLVFVGHLTRTKGVEEVIEEFPKVIRNFQEVKLYIIGSGPYETQLKKLSGSLNLEHYVNFLGYMDHNTVLKLLPKFDVGLAPYNYNDDYVRFCDPVKVKEYLACGCAVIISNIPEISLEISREHAGLVYASNEELQQSILMLLKDDKTLNDYRKNAINLSRKYDWNTIFDYSFFMTIGS